MSSKSNELNNNTCYVVHQRYNLPCNKKSCKNWVNSEENNNCIFIAADKNNYTLSEVGKIYGLTRMRICQIEKSICRKLRREVEK
jgi:DNA-directed RNA polymerase specialized sigma subunit